VIARIIARVVEWAEQRPDLRAVALVGSQARNTATSDSDVDLILLSTQPQAYVQDDSFLRALSAKPLLTREWGVVTERRVELEGMEVELNFAPLSWAALAPIDLGTRRVVLDGLRILHDPDRLLEDLRCACLEAPALETARLLLRGHRRDDLRECAEMWADPTVTEHISGKPFTEEEVWTKVVRYLGHWSMMGFGYWVVREKSSGRFVGEVGFADFKRAITPSFDGAPEAGWVLAPWAQGQGYATEAVRAVHVWLDERFGPTRTVCMIAPENAASIRVAEKCHYREWVRTTYREQPTILFQRDPSVTVR
jgi:RimJ/RimL family protein N-acetyltransferase/predicted nucleotidyltransferase